MSSSLVAASPALLRPRSDLRGFDLSEPPASGFWACALNSGYEKAVIRMYQQACGRGGKVDKNFVAIYNAAVAAGFTNIDAYVFPCTGTQPTGVTCKPVQTQINEILNVFSANNIIIQNIWFDVEPSSGECNAWNLGRAANLALAEEWVSAMKATGLQWGVYANR
ncbi:hypothetical protein MMC29_003944 [Sticta canariensis]|nr:hypothetical protein [Sticta canariensis]